ncbi:type II secretion system inner membrane protein GspF [Endozoicomonas ascidiicola]|uniref:type II secretion system inner membrane protein GspF n=1 Tax=Endozoicomonas ascidiicola TaxID=1698521 RepID=UPI00082E67A9|nr:type II secretion system inner membrane protein GspF [Endozoicomonas ascidiicola]
MAAFEFLALDDSGRQQKGSQEADSGRQVRQSLRDKGWTPLSVEVVKGQSAGEQSSINALFQRGVSARELATLTRQMATLVQAAMPVEEVLYGVALQQEKKHLKNLLMSVRSRILEGYPLAKSMEAYPAVFPEMYRATVAAGEKSGFLDKVLSQLADYTENRMHSMQKVQQALIYPVILMLASVVIVGFLLGFVVPDIIKIFIDTGQTLPWITRALVAASDFFQSYWAAVVLAIAIFFLTFNQMLKKPPIRLQWDRLLLRLPFIGRFSRTLNTARFASTLSILTRSGVPLVDALSIAGQVVSNQALHLAIQHVSKSVSEGSSLYKALQETGCFPPLMLHMINSGEATGELDNMLERTATSQQMELDGRISLTLGLFEPLMLVLMGGIVMLIVMAILLPILNMNQLMS